MKVFSGQILLIATSQATIFINLGVHETNAVIILVHVNPIYFKPYLKFPTVQSVSVGVCFFHLFLKKMSWWYHYQHHSNWLWFHSVKFENSRRWTWKNVIPVWKSHWNRYKNTSAIFNVTWMEKEGETGLKSQWKLSGVLRTEPNECHHVVMYSSYSERFVCLVML